MPQANAVSARPAARLQKAPDYVRCMEVYLTDRCNLSCANCAVHRPAKASAGRCMKWEELKAAIDTLMDPAQLPHKGEKVLLLAGGEPFMAFPLLRKAAKYLNGLPRKPSVYVYTNGTLAKPAWVRELRDQGFMIIFSLDGDKAGNDKYRTFKAGAKKSVWDAAMKNIASLPMEAPLGTSTVLRPGNLDGVLSALDRFSASGFQACDLWIDYLHVWSDEELAELEKFMESFGDYYVRRTTKEGKIPFYVPMMHHALYNAVCLKQGKSWWRDCFRITVGADGSYYDCQGVLCAPYDKVAGFAVNRVGDRKGVDWAAREKYMDEAAAYLDKMGADRDWQHVCPRVYYKVAKVLGADPKPFIDNLHRVSRVFLQGFVKAASRLRENPSFNDFYVSADLTIVG